MPVYYVGYLPGILLGVSTGECY